MSAETLREAAAKMRERAEAATPGPWEAFRRGDPAGPFGVCAESAGDVDPDIFDGGTRTNAEYIASWHPVVALAVADWLDRTARQYATLLAAWELGDDNGLSMPAIANQTSLPQALAVARAYLGGDA